MRTKMYISRREKRPQHTTRGYGAVKEQQKRKNEGDSQEGDG